MTTRWEVLPEDERPARQDGTCFYCSVKIGGRHKDDCVIPTREVRMKLVIEFPVEIPNFWDKDMAEFHWNMSSSCQNNLLTRFEEYVAKLNGCGPEDHVCVCGHVKATYEGEMN